MSALVTDTSPVPEEEKQQGEVLSAGTTDNVDESGLGKTEERGNPSIGEDEKDSATPLPQESAGGDQSKESGEKRFAPINVKNKLKIMGSSVRAFGNILTDSATAVASGATAVASSAKRELLKIAPKKVKCGCMSQYIQLTVPETGAARDGSYMLYSIFVHVPSLNRAWMVSRRFSEFVVLDRALDAAGIKVKYDGVTPFEVNLPKRFPWVGKTDIHLTRTRRRCLEAYLWERVYEKSVLACTELALFISPHLLLVDDSDIKGVNGVYCETEDTDDETFIFARCAPKPSATRFVLKREVRWPEHVYDHSDPKLGVRFWILETQLQWGGQLPMRLYGNRDGSKKPPSYDWCCTSELSDKYTESTIVCLYDQDFTCQDVLDAIRALPETNGSFDDKLTELVSPTFKSGTLKKKGRFVKSWKSRVFVLDFDTGTLEYYSTDGALLKGSLQVSGAEVSISDEDPKKFSITTTEDSGSRTLDLESTSEAATLDWASSIQKIATRALELGNKKTASRNSWK